MFYIWLIPLLLLLIVLFVAFFMSHREPGSGERKSGRVISDSGESDERDLPP